jgi:ubiquinone/menaquinone biosynthesis C-methylase UbiE
MNNRNILQLLEPRPHDRLVDLGCLDGKWTEKIAKIIHASEVYGVDLDEEGGHIASASGIHFLLADLSSALPFDDNSVDVVHSNQVIEHLSNVDMFLQEISRILRPGGYAIISTENLASIDNILALVAGQQPFSQHISRKSHIGNRFSPHFGKPILNPLSVHRTIFTYYGLGQIIQSYNLVVETELGAGYPPFPPAFARVDSIHARFITIKARKKKTE